MAERLRGGLQLPSPTFESWWRLLSRIPRPRPGYSHVGHGPRDRGSDAVTMAGTQPEPVRERIKVRVKRRRIGQFGANWIDSRRGRRAITVSVVIGGLLLVVLIWYVTPKLLGTLGDSGGGGGSTPSSEPSPQ